MPFRNRHHGAEDSVAAQPSIGDDFASSSANDVKDEKHAPKLPVTIDDKLEEGEDEEVTTAPDEVEDDPQLRDIPWQVRQVVSFHDDPTLPTITFRYFVLTLVFIAPGAFLSQMSAFRTSAAPYSVFFVQIASHYAGEWMARVTPSKVIFVPFTQWSFNLNPGPFSVKEHVLITVSAASGATSNLGATPIALAELYYGDTIHPAAAIFFMFAIVWTGYSFAAIARQFLLYAPEYPWFQALMQTSLFETMRTSSETNSKSARKQMKVFFLALAGMTAWQFLPEYIFPFLSSLAFLCWVAPHNATANFIGSGLGGMGLLNLSLDWANISNYNSGINIFLSPWWTQVIFFLAFVLSAWILIPAAKWGGLGSYKFGLMSNHLFTASGDLYPTEKLITPDANLNQTAYEEYGQMYMGTHNTWALFFDYASYISGIVWVLIFGYKQLSETVRKINARNRNKTQGETINHQYNDKLNIIQRSYKEVPWWWYTTLFVASFVIIITLLGRGMFFIPIWTYFVALGTGAVVVVPFGWLYAISNYQVESGSFNELLYGYMLNAASSGHRHPAGPSVYGSIAGDAWYRAQYMLQDQKIGHYMHIPPRAIFFSQIFGTLIGVPLNYGVVRWVLDTKGEYLSGAKEDPLHQWTGQSLASSNTLGVQYALVGPTRLFQEHLLKPLPFSFLMGAGAPLVIYALHRTFPRARFDLWNTTIFFSGMSFFYGNISTGYISKFIGGWVVMYWAYRKRYDLWRRWNYILAAAFDTGFNLSMLLMFIFFSAGKQVFMPNWWGNADNVERCFAMDDS